MMLSENFSLDEFKCHDGSITPPDALENLKKLAVNLEVLRKHLGKAVHVNSGYRSPAYNQTLKGASPVSQHLHGKASDLRVDGVTPKALAAVIEGLIKKGLMKEGGIGIYPTFTHYDIRGTRARW
jgi:uncharacterized protein YcbK (DUF882 family)